MKIEVNRASQVIVAFKPPLVFERYFGYGWFSGSRSRTAGTLAHCTMIACTCEDRNLDWTIGGHGCAQIRKDW